MKMSIYIQRNKKINILHVKYKINKNKLTINPTSNIFKKNKIHKLQFHQIIIIMNYLIVFKSQG